MERPEGMGRINQKPQRDYQLFPKQFLNKHMTAVGNAEGALGDHVALEPRQVENVNMKMSRGF